jgi:hypothetical protein
MPWASDTWEISLRPLEEQGYLIVATNTDTVDYIACAVRLAASIRKWHLTARICLITNQEVNDIVFDHVRQLPTHCKTNPWANDWQVAKLTPFRETIKLEADMLIASSIEHWWTMFRHRDVVVSTGCRNWKDQTSTARHYRAVFDENKLPDVYNAVTYWRLSETSQEFFRYVRDIFERWDQYRTMLKFPDEVPSTDLVYAMAAQIVGVERVTMPFATYPKIVHMKQHHADTTTQDWTRELVWEHNPLRINTVAQWGAFHYHIKDWK